MASALASDVLIVGGGMAGLTAAAYLAKAGLNVRLCEKERKTGGLVNSFAYKGFVFDGGIRAIEDSGIVHPMLRQLGLEVEFLPNPVSVGIGKDVIRVSSKDSLRAYQQLLEKHFPESKADIAGIVREIAQVMGYMDVLYGIDNPLFVDLRNNPGYVLRTILPWACRYMLTIPSLSRRRQPVDVYLARFSTNQALIDIVAQHFFQKTPAFFALSYFSLYLDYQYPKGGTGALAGALEQCVLQNGGDIRRETAITRVEPGRNLAVDSGGQAYGYRKLIWASDAKTLYRIVDLHSLTHDRVVRDIRAHQEAVADKIGGDSVFTLYLTVKRDKAWFGQISSAHFFYTPSTSGLSQAPLQDLRAAGQTGSAEFTPDKARIIAWLERYLALTTYEISCPVLRDASLAPEGQTGLIISTLFDYGLTRHIERLGWYEEFRRLASDHVVAVLDASIYPGLSEAVSGRFTSTPLTLERISGNAEGAITGWAFTNASIPAVNQMPQVARSVLTPIPDTYQAGQWTYSPSGLPIAILTGKLAADRVLKDLA